MGRRIIKLIYLELVTVFDYILCLFVSVVQVVILVSSTRHASLRYGVLYVDARNERNI